MVAVELPPPAPEPEFIVVIVDNLLEFDLVLVEVEDEEEPCMGLEEADIVVCRSMSASKSPIIRRF